AFARSSGSRWGWDVCVRQQPVLDREQARTRAARGVDLRIDVLDVAAARLRGDDQACGDLLVREPAREQLQDLDLAFGQSRGTLSPAGNPVAGGSEHGVDGVSVEPAGFDLGAQLPGGVV